MRAESEHSGFLKLINHSGLNWFFSAVVYSPSYEFPGGFTDRINHTLLCCLILLAHPMEVALMHRDRRLSRKNPGWRGQKAKQK